MKIFIPIICLKFRQNKKTYQQIIFEMAGLKFSNEPYIYNVSEDERSFADNIMGKHKIRKGQILVGLNTGAGLMFQFKK